MTVEQVHEIAITLDRMADLHASLHRQSSVCHDELASVERQMIELHQTVPDRQEQAA